MSQVPPASSGGGPTEASEELVGDSAGNDAGQPDANPSGVGGTTPQGPPPANKAPPPAPLVGAPSPGATPPSQGTPPPATTPSQGTPPAEGTPPSGTPPWSAPAGVPPWGIPPWAAGAPATTPPWGTPPGGATPPWGEPGRTWFGWYPGPPGQWTPAPAQAGASPPTRRRIPVVWSIVGATLLVLAIIGAGIGIGYAVWGSGSSNASAVSPLRPGAPSHRSAPTTPAHSAAFLGVEISPGGFLTGAATRKGAGAHVIKVVAGSPAAKAGIASGDTITAFGTRRVASGLTLQFDVQHDAPGQSVKVAWTTSSGKHESATVKLAKRPSSQSVG